MSNKTYDVLKWVALTAFPAVVVFLQTLSGIWGWENGDKITLTVAAVELLLGGFLGVKSVAYNKGDDGTIVLNMTDPEAEVFSLENPIAPSDMVGRSSVKFSVRRDS